MLSDNINQKFFEGQIDLIEFTNEDGTKEKYKWTIALLKEWLGEIGVSQEIIQKSIRIIKKVRSQRSKPSHNIRDNQFNINTFKIIIILYWKFIMHFDY